VLCTFYTFAVFKQSAQVASLTVTAYAVAKVSQSG
jgi:hypothetical protein